VIAKTALVVVMATLGSQGLHAQTCLVSGTAVQFGAYNPIAARAVETTGSVTVTCTTVLPASIAYTIALSGGSSGQINNRSLKGIFGELKYQLYVDGSHAQLWGDGTGGSRIVADSYQLPSLGSMDRRYTVYGYLPGRQPVKPGLYTDTILITLTF
jgi:spore coat protein U-like protein